MKYFEKIKGENIYLSPMNVEDAEIYTKWMNDKELTQNIGRYHHIFTIEVERKWLEKNSTIDYNFSIILKETDELIGNVSLVDVDHINQTAELGIFIGEESQRNKGYGKEAVKLILDYGFNTLNLNNVMLTVYVFNKRGINAYKSIGFQEMGVRRQSIYKNGKKYDEVYMDILKNVFNKRYN